MSFNEINQFYSWGSHKWEEYSNDTKNHTLNATDLMNEVLNSTGSYYENETRTNDDQIQRLEPLCVIIFVTICYSIISLAGLLGNVITCIVISKNKSMHTATNYYLFNLAISDLTLLLAGMPQEIYNMWFPNQYDFPETVCVLRGLLSETSTNATVLTIVSFTIERYIAICHPFRQHTMSKLSRAVKFIMVVWIVSFCFAVPQAMQFVVVSDISGKKCTVEAVPVVDPFYISTFCFFVVPMTLICVLYILIGIKLKNSKTLHGIKRDNCEIAHSTISSQTRIIRMLIAVVVAFFLCWAPFHAQRLAAVHGNKFKRNAPIPPLYTALTHISGILYFMSTCINPLLYSIMSHKFRNAFKITIMKHVRIGTHCMKPEHTYSMLSRYNGLGSMKMSITATNNNNNKQRNSNPYISDMARIEIANIRNDTSTDSTYVQIADECLPMSTNNHSALQQMKNSDKFTSKNNKTDLKTRTKLRSLNEKNRRQKIELQRISDSKRPSNRNNNNNNHNNNNSNNKNNNNNNSRNKKTIKPEKSIPKITSTNSIWSASTISNTSLQEYDDTELNTAELAKYMRQINNEIRH